MSFITRTLLRNVPAILKEQSKQNLRTVIFNRFFHKNAALLSEIKIQQSAPNFKGLAVIDGEFKEIELNDYKGQYLVLFFYPLDFTFVCPTEIISFSDRIKEFKELNTKVVGVSVDSQFSHLAWQNQSRKAGGIGQLKYPLLADITKKISRDYGVLLENEGISLRGTFIIDANGILRQYSVNDLPVGRSIDEILRLIKAFQYVEQHGEVCPANWNPESNPDTIKPDVDESKQYFDKHG